jgi:RNA polymerase sigma-70 factor (ECF subfamily)
VISTRGDAGEDLDAAVVAALGGDEAAAAAVFRAVQPALVAYLRSQAPASAVDDLAGEVWLAIARGSAASVSSMDQLRAMVFTIARRRVVDLRRAERRRPEVPLDEHPTEPTAPDVADLAVQHVSGDAAVGRLLRGLTPEQAEVVLLRVVGGLSAEAVATVTDRTPGSVRVIQHRALRRMAAELRSEAVTP